jgi:polysaccharide export outer membrane protein
MHQGTLREGTAVNRTMAWLKILGILATAALPLVAGCKDPASWWKTDQFRFLGPEKTVRPPEGTPINPILGSIGPTDRVEDIVPNATFPREGDWSYTDEEYIIGPTDILDISILDLFADGLETVLRRQVTNAGLIDLPLLAERILVAGYTKEQVKDIIRDAYSPEILVDPTVSVTIAARRQNTFSILGAVNRPGTYNILRKDMRLLEAMAMAGGVTQSNIHYLYVIRPKRAPVIRTERKAIFRGKPVGPEQLPPLPPEAPGTAPATTQPTTQPTTGPSLEARLRELSEALGGPKSRPATQPGSTPTPAAMRFTETADAGAPAATKPPDKDDELTRAAKAGKWIYSAGKWVRAPQRPETSPATTREAPRGRDPSDPFGWKKLDKSDLARVIAINLKQLRSGDPRMNIVVRDNDIVQIPPLEVGEFYVMGEVLRPGVYSLTGRQITVKMAVAAAGNMTALAWPENSILIRRIGGYQEQVIPLDLEAIFRGGDPDVYLKPNDVIAVGTDVRSSFFAVMRNAFRMTYGFGFIYDRNFEEPVYRTPTSNRFTRL